MKPTEISYAHEEEQRLEEANELVAVEISDENTIPNLFSDSDMVSCLSKFKIAN